MSHRGIQARRNKNQYSEIWWQAGGIAVANCLFAYQFKGAASKAASYINLDGSGTYGLSDGAAAPSWTAAALNFTQASSQYVDIGGGTGPTSPKPFSMIARLNPTDAGTTRAVFGGAVADTINFLINTSNQPRFVIQSTNINTTMTVTSDKVVGFSYDASGNYIWYQNGASFSSGTNNRTPSGDIDRIGRHITSSYYGGDILALALYNSVLTPAQFAATYLMLLRI